MIIKFQLDHINKEFYNKWNINDFIDFIHLARYNHIKLDYFLLIIINFHHYFLKYNLMHLMLQFIF